MSSAQNWWLRSPNPGNANNVRNVNTSGGMNNNNANNSYAAVPDCGLVPERVGKEPKAVPPRREGPSRLRNGGNDAGDAHGPRDGAQQAPADESSRAPGSLTHEGRTHGP